MKTLIAPILEWISSSQQFFQEWSLLGILMYAGLILVVQLFLAPLAPFAIASGLIFGWGRGVVAVVIGTAAGAAVNFLLARHIAREPLLKRLAKSEKFRLIDAAIGREGWKIVMLLRFCPIPYGLANYCYGLTAVRFWPYLLATVIAILPANCFFAYLGATAQEGLAAVTGAGRERHWFEYVLMGASVVAAFVALTFVARIARAAVANHGDGTETIRGDGLVVADGEEC